jgi:endonuclease YncB( thermonuclease family)
VLSRRRIFRSSSFSAPGRWRGALLVAVFSLGAVALAGLGLPASLLGSAPAEQDWTAAAASVRVVDGDTLRLGERTLRLSGLLSPERGQTCRTAGGVGFDCGATAAEALARLVQGRDLSCHLKGRDGFGRPLGHCVAGDVQVNAALIASGWALADGTAMATLEAEARRAGRGLWSHLPGAPEDWQRR